MKTYFAKYLPVDFIQDTPDEPTVKTKLFLCSRDIEVGDKWFHINGEGVTSEEQICTEIRGIVLYSDNMFAPLDSNVYKVIGEISPDALSYVKERDEFDFEDWEDEVDGNHRLTGKIIIKGPCGHFH